MLQTDLDLGLKYLYFTGAVKASSVFICKVKSVGLPRSAARRPTHRNKEMQCQFNHVIIVIVVIMSSCHAIIIFYIATNIHMIN